MAGFLDDYGVFQRGILPDEVVLQLGGGEGVVASGWWPVAS
jgi:hypothetical protein